MQDMLNLIILVLRSMKEQLLSFPVIPFLFYNIEEWSNAFKMKIRVKIIKVA